jgi:hypothetical protein
MQMVLSLAWNVGLLLDAVNLVPVLARNERCTLGFRESKCFLRGPEILIVMNNYRLRVFENRLLKKRWVTREKT